MPRTGWMPVVLLIIALVVITAVIVATRPQSATLEDIQRMVDGGSVDALQLEESTLTATTDSGRYQVQGIQTDQIRPDALARGIPYAEVQAPEFLSPMLVIWSFTPYAAIAVILGVLFALIRRNRAGPRPAAAT